MRPSLQLFMTRKPGLGPRNVNTPAAGLSTRIMELDGLRGLAITLVVAYHYVYCLTDPGLAAARSYVSKSLALGWSGVDLFFVLSGFLIGGKLLDSRGSAAYFRVFFLRRAIRIMPLYYFLLFCFPVLEWYARRGLALDWLTASSFPFFSYLFFLQNFWVAHRSTFGPAWLGVTWSLAIEEQFYWILPLLICLLSSKRLVQVLWFTVFISPFLRWLVLHFSSGATFAGLPAYVLFFFRADTLAMGVLLAVALRDSRMVRALRRKAFWIGAVFLFQSVGLLLLLGKDTYFCSPPMLLIGYSWLGAYYTSWLGIVLLFPRALVARFLRWSVLRRLGVVSYGVYLIHQPMLGLTHAWILRTAPSNREEGVWVTALACVLTYFLAEISWRYLESPLLQKARAFTAPSA